MSKCVCLGGSQPGSVRLYGRMWCVCAWSGGLVGGCVSESVRLSVCVSVSGWVRGSETSASQRTRHHFPQIKDSFTYMTLVILQLYSVTYVSQHRHF